MQSSLSEANQLQPSWLGFAHRGLHGPGVPENSLAAFRAAATFTAGAECDVRLARDGVPVVFHDADLRRMCGTDERIDVSDSSWLSGKALLGTNETIPTLAEMLTKWPKHLPLLIECKSSGEGAPELAGAVASALRNCSRVAGIMSFDPIVSRCLSAHQMNFPRGLVVDAEWPVDYRARAVEHARPQFIAVDVRLLGDPWTETMRAQMPVYTWTVRTAAQRRQAAVHADAAIWEDDGRP